VALLAEVEDDPTSETRDEPVRVALSALSPDVVLVRVSAGGLGTLELADRIAAAVPEANVIALAYSSPAETATTTAVHGGRPEDLPIELAASGGTDPAPRERPLDSSLELSRARRLRERQGVRESPLGRLTPREREILGMLADGISGGQIARKLSVSPNTIRSHIQNIRSKLNVHSRLQAVTLGIRHGIRGPAPD
jgi:DNA-binding NarL/FixJ family response regulator